MILCQGTAPEVAISGICFDFSRFSRGYGSWKGRGRAGGVVDALRIAGVFHGEISLKGDASMVLVVVVLVLGLLGRKWWMAGGGGGGGGG